MAFVALLMALFLAAVHLFSGRLYFLDSVPRSRWLSIAGGVSVAYVFVNLLPELAEQGRSSRRRKTRTSPFSRS